MGRQIDERCQAAFAYAATLERFKETILEPDSEEASPELMLRFQVATAEVLDTMVQHLFNEVNHIEFTNEIVFRLRKQIEEQGRE